MPRPRLCRRVHFNARANYFKPQGTPMINLEVVELSAEEVEALRLKNVKDLGQVEAAKKMRVSQPTFGRTLDSAYKKIAKALIYGKAIKIEENK